MPNYVRNKVYFQGEPDEVKKMLEQIQVDGRGPGSIDFNKIIPMPASLNIEAGSRTDEGLKMYRAYMTAREQKKDIGRFLRYREEHEDSWNLGKQAFENIRQFGCATWYDWCIQNWGTKWPAMQDGDKPESQEILIFDTAWSFPDGVMERLSQMYPAITITAEWADEDIGRNCGKIVYEKGKAGEVFFPSGDRESIEFATSVWDSTPADWNLRLSEDGMSYVYDDMPINLDGKGEAR